MHEATTRMKKISLAGHAVMALLARLRSTAAFAGRSTGMRSVHEQTAQVDGCILAPCACAGKGAGIVLVQGIPATIRIEAVHLREWFP